MVKPLLSPKRTTPRFVLTHKVGFTLLRKSPGTRVNGRWIEGTELAIEAQGNIQPLKGSELLALPESDRTKESIKVYTVETLKTLTEVDATQADHIIWEGKRFVAAQTFTYKMGVLDHTKTICFRLPETPDNLARYVEPTPPVEPGDDYGP